MLDPVCVNLADRYGAVYRITYDPAYDPAHVPHDKRDPRYMQMPCDRGTIYPHGGEMLAVEVDYRPKVAAKVAALPGVVVHQDGDHEKTFLFDVSLFAQVAALVRPRRRFRSSAAQLDNLRHGEKHQFRGGVDGVSPEKGKMVRAGGIPLGEVSGSANCRREGAD